MMKMKMQNVCVGRVIGVVVSRKSVMELTIELVLIGSGYGIEACFILASCQD